MARVLVTGGSGFIGSLLGWTPISREESLVATAKSMMALGLLKG